MCTICGCGPDEVKIEKVGVRYPYAGRRVKQVEAMLPAVSENGGVCVHGYGEGEAGGSVVGLSQSRMVRLEQSLLAKNQVYADRNRGWLEGLGVLSLNLVSSPGSGKTTLLVETIRRWQARTPLMVIEGDQQTSHDAERIRAAGAAALQINTGKGCHLDAAMIEQALQQLAVPKNSVLMIENVGNLVCPAGFDLGERHKVAILSVTEGAEKPLKYPDLFAAAAVMVVNKVDLLPYVDFDVAQCVAYARRVNPALEVMLVSARTGEGMADWLGWLERQQQQMRV